MDTWMAIRWQFQPFTREGPEIFKPGSQQGKRNWSALQSNCFNTQLFRKKEIKVQKRKKECDQKNRSDWGSHEAMPLSPAIWKSFRLLRGVTAATCLREKSTLWTSTAVFYLGYDFLMVSNATTLWDYLWKQIRSIIASIKRLVYVHSTFSRA